MSIREHVQRFDLGARVTLFELDLTDFGEGVLRFTAGTEGVASAIEFRGEVYSPHPIEATGFEITGDGPLPQPKLAVSNIGGVFTALVEQHNDLEGAQLTRLQTYERFLDNGPEPDPDAVRPPDVYLLSQKTRHDDLTIEWKLVSLIDQEGVVLPARKVVRDYCDHTYRRWNGVAFDYSEATCPYAGAGSFDVSDVAVANGLDVCGKRIGSCQKRFGETAALPYRGFPGVARLRAR